MQKACWNITTLIVAVTLFLFVIPKVKSAEVRMFGGMNAADWTLNLGREFPGAEGALEFQNNGESAALKYDFSKGGNYVAIINRKKLPSKFSLLKLRFEAKQNTFITYRLIDSTGRIFQNTGKQYGAGKGQSLVIDPEGPWKAVFGGPKKKKGKGAKTPQLPFQKVFVVFSAPRGAEEKSREIVLSGMSAEVDEELTIPAKYEPVDFELAGWKIKGKWIKGWPVSSLSATVTGGGRDGELAISLPAMARPEVQRFSLEKGKTLELYYTPSLPELNPRNRYRVNFEIKTPMESAQQYVAIHGGLSEAVNLGEPKSSTQIRKLPFGTCVHFHRGMKDPNGAFSIWSNYIRLLDEAEKCGFKWIRGHIGMQEDEKGNQTICPDALLWLNAAKERGLQVIGLIEMSARKTPKDWKKIAQETVRKTKGLVAAYELGNEPQNGGRWRQVYEGPWNGKEKDNSTSQWVKEHLKATNLMAQAIHEIDPNAKIIGLGACPPTNFRYLDLGLSPLVTGVVEHPYPFSMPPEKIPYGTNMEKRDGVRVGDDQNTYEGLVRSYIDKFKNTGHMRELWVTEFGYTTFWLNGDNRNNLYLGYTEYAQAVYLTRRFMMSLALPVVVSCQYDLIDDFGSTPYYNEANFGILRSDFSRKPSYYAIQRMNSLLAECVLDESVNVKVTDDKLHRGQVRGELIRDWDKANINANNGVAAYVFANPEAKNEKTLALWSMQPVGGESNNRVVSLRINKCADHDAMPVAINLITGETFDLPLTKSGDALLMNNISLTDAPLIIKLFKRAR